MLALQVIFEVTSCHLLFMEVSLESPRGSIWESIGFPPSSLLLSPDSFVNRPTASQYSN